MSVTILRYVPNDPYWQPTAEAAEEAVLLVRSITPASESIEKRFEEKVRFYDPGENWSGVECGMCGADAEAWWGDAMDRAFTTDFVRLDLKTPCCDRTTSLNDLRYVWPAAFGRFSIEAISPSIADTTAEQDLKIARCLGAPLRKIWVRY